jgi:transcriptional regulator with XRE-family HTH domain
MDMRRLVGRNVRRIRQNKSLTQEQLADISGFSQQYISRLERGRRNPSIITLCELSVALGVSHIDLLRPIRSFGVPASAVRPGSPVPFATVIATKAQQVLIVNSKARPTPS